MAVLDFRNFLESRINPARDWSQNEIGEFLRAQNLLSQNGVSIGIDRGLSDVGEPWLVFFDTQSEDVFLHIARIGGRCVLVSEPLALRLWAADVSELMQRFDLAVRALLKDRDEHNGKVVQHPAARMIMAISAVFLLFKLDHNSNVYAKEDHHLTNDVLGRKVDTSVLMRVQSAMARLLESAEVPATMAAVAGALLIQEIAKGVIQASEAEVGAAAHEGVPDADILVMGEVENLSHGEVGALVPVVGAAIAVSPGSGDFVATIPVTWLDNLATELAEKVAAAFQFSIPAVAVVVPPSQPVAEAAQAPATMIVAAQTVSAPLSAGASAAPLSVAALVIQQMFNIELTNASIVVIAAEDVVFRPLEVEGDVPEATVQDDVVTPSVPAVVALNAEPPLSLPTTPSVSVIVPEFVSERVVEDISLSTLWALENSVGYFASQSATSRQLNFAVDYLVKAFGDVELEINGEYLLFEQAGLAGTALDDIGIWRHTFDGGSSITFVGQAHIVAELQGLI